MLVGDGPERGRLVQRARELGVTGSVCLVGTHAEFADYLRHADAFVLPSEVESFGVAALEALASGVPVLGYRVGWLPEVVTADAGHNTVFDVRNATQPPRFEVKAPATGRRDRPDFLHVWKAAGECPN